MSLTRETLDELALRHGTDKASGRHDYTRVYESFLGPIRDEPVNVVEVGVYQGASVRMWRDYFPNGQIYAIDFTPSAAEHASDRIEIFIGPQQDQETLDAVLAAAPELDLIIDDGSHRYPHQFATMQRLWPALKPGGIYIMEDVHTSYLEKYDMGFRQRLTTIEMMKDLIDDLHVRFHQQPTSLAGVGSVHFYFQMCVITKKPKPAPRAPKVVAPT